MSIHDGHRQRRLETFLKIGFDNMHPHEVLELLLFYAIPRQDTNPIAHRLIDNFGSLSAVFDAAYEDLIRIEGVGPKAATLIKMVPELARAYIKDMHDTEIVNSKEDVARVLLPRFVGKKQEIALVLCLDNKHKVITCVQVSEGTVSTTSLEMRKVIEQAMRHNAAYIILAHNHPSGSALPSPEDIAVTRELEKLCRQVSVPLLDHFVVANDGDYISMASSNLMGGYR